MKPWRPLALSAVLLLVMCRDELRGCHCEARGPQVQVDMRTTEPPKPVPEDKRDYIGLWIAPDARLLIEPDGKLSYHRSGDGAERSVESSIQAFDANGFMAGHEPVETYFRVNRPPHAEEGRWKMTVGGVEFYRTEDYRTLAAKYLEGDGVPKDLVKAAELLSKACNDNHDELSCGLLGGMYEGGKGVPVDLSKAAELYGKACAEGDALTCSMLGGLYFQGKGVSKDVKRAIELLTTTCDQGDALGCFNLGVAYDSGEGITRDPKRALELYKKACDSGKAEACQNLAIMHETGEGTPKDLPRALDSYAKACKGGLAQSCAYAKVLTDTLLSDDRERRRTTKL